MLQRKNKWKKWLPCIPLALTKYYGWKHLAEHKIKEMLRRQNLLVCIFIQRLFINRVISLICRSNLHQFNIQISFFRNIIYLRNRCESNSSCPWYTSILKWNCNMFSDYKFIQPVIDENKIKKGTLKLKIYRTRNLKIKDS